MMRADPVVVGEGRNVINKKYIYIYIYVCVCVSIGRQVKWAVVESAREVYSSVRVGERTQRL